MSNYIFNTLKNHKIISNNYIYIVYNIILSNSNSNNDN